MKIFLYILVGIAAILIMAMIVFNFDPQTETWTSLILGGIAGFGLYKMPSLFRKKNTKA